MSNPEQALVPAGAPEPASMLMPAHVAAVVPAEHFEIYRRLTLQQQQRVSQLLACFREMATAPEGVVAAAERLSVSTIALAAPSLIRLYYAYRRAEAVKKGTGWLKLAKIYKGPTKLPPEFVQEVRRRIENNAVSARAAITELRTLWAEGQPVAGYGRLDPTTGARMPGTWREYFKEMFPLEDIPERFPFGFHPPGWSESNLYEQQSSRAERAMKRRGYAAAKRYLPHVMRDLSQLRFMELIVIDDFETDQMVRAWNPDTKRWQNCRCAGLLAIDAATRTKLAIGLKPRWTDDEGKKQSLTRADVQTLLYEVFRAWGRPAGYNVTILCENGGAAISGDFELALELLMGVQVSRTGLIHEKTLRNGFVQGGGKPWEKPWIESMFRLMHSTAGALPGQKGATYQLKPADLEAKLLYTEKLLNTEGITPEIVAQLHLPLMTVEQFLAAYERVFQRMEERTDHKLQGFEERHLQQLPNSHKVVAEEDLGLLNLTPEQILACTPVTVMESPRERRERLLKTAGLKPVAELLLAMLLLTPRKVKLANHRLTFTWQGKGYTFADADSAVMKLAEGTELLGYFDPARPGTLHVTDLQGRYVGPVRARGRVDIRDQAAIGAEQAEVSRLIHACVTGPLRERHAAEDGQLGADRAHNEALLRQHNLLPADPTPSTSTTPSGKSSGDTSALVSAPAGASEQPRATITDRPAGLSRKLAQAPARDAFKAYKESLALAQGIAGEVSKQLDGKTRAEALQQADDDLDAGQLL